jgi:ADP-heptose:LPS heptosyltransferase
VTRVLVVRLDGAGDVVLAGPAVRAIAARSEVTLLCGPAGVAAGRLLPGVADVLTWACPWVLGEPPPVARDDIEALVAAVAAGHFDEAVILTSFHQSPLPLALLLRLAGVPRISGASVDYPGSLLDVRLRPGETLAEDQPEPERMLAIAGAAGFALRPGDTGALAVLPRRRCPPWSERVLRGRPPRSRGARPPLAGTAGRPRRGTAGRVRTAGAGHRRTRRASLTAQVAGRYGTISAGAPTWAELTGVLAGASSIVVGNTAAAHLAAAVGTPVVSLFAPVVPAVRWQPYRVPHALLGDQTAACAGSRAGSARSPGTPAWPASARPRWSPP